MKSNSILIKFGYSIIANMLSLIASSLLVIIVPKFITQMDYGYWQLYLFYVGYVGLLQFGWCDGIYLRIGGQEYSELNSDKISSQFKIFSIFQILLTLTIFIIVMNFFPDSEKLTILYFTSFNIILVNIKGFISYILQATARIKEYSIITILDKILYAFFIFCFLFLKFADFKFILLADIIAKSITMCLSFYYCKNLLFRKGRILRKDIDEMIINVKVGMSLMVSNLMGSLILGIARFFIEGNWGIEEFGKVSFSLSLSNILVIFISAISTVLFPLIKRIPQKESKKIFLILRDSLDISIICILLFFFPMKELVLRWLPKYEISLFYLVLLIPLCIFQARTTLILTTYIKALRLEKKLAVINTICGCLSVFISYITVYLLNSISLTCIAISAIFYIHSLLCEYAVSANMKVSFMKNSLMLLFILILFIISCLFSLWYIGMFFYLLVILVVLSIRKNNITNLIKNLKSLIKSK